MGFARFLKDRRIDIVHAHGTSLFFSALAGWLVPKATVVWHDHFGRYATEDRCALLYRLATARTGGIIAVNEFLADWARTRLKVCSERVWYVPNFVVEKGRQPNSVDLPGRRGKRIVCVANLRPEKNHLMLIDAMKEVVKAEQMASLLLVGAQTHPQHAERIKNRIVESKLEQHVFMLGSRDDVASILSVCDVGVLASSSEGMPLALLEYGLSGLAVVATRVGQVPEVLDEGRSGILTAPGSPNELAAALLKLFSCAKLREELGGALRSRVQRKYGELAVMDRIVQIYEVLMGKGGKVR
jgi:glycosyltransferase involved in cell wall biosynthesis